MSLSQLRPKSDSAVVRNMLNDIERALSSGVSRESIWKALCEEQRLKISFEGFAKALFRARKSRRVADELPGGSGFSRSVENQGRSGPDCLQGSIESNETSVKAVAGLPSRPSRIRTTRDFESVHKMDFNEFDDKFK